MNSSRPIYLDYAAATPMADFVIAAMQPYLAENFYNPSSPYKVAVDVRNAYEAAKQRLAQSFGAKGDECVITAGATESINLAFSNISGHTITTEIEHPAVLEVVKQNDYTIVKVNKYGRVDPDDIISAIRPDTELISVGFANNEIGTLQPLRKIAQQIKHIRQARLGEGNTTPLLFHTDASQGFGQIDINVARLGVDLLTLNAAKIYGPKQVGVLWARPSVILTPTVIGGGQERGLRSGTENVAGTIGFATASEWAAKHHHSENKRLTVLRSELQNRLIEAFPEMMIFGDPKHHLPGHLSVGFPGIDAERIIFMIEASVLLATGSACSANKHTASHVLKAIGVEEKYINGSLRMTLGKQTTKEEVIHAAEILINALRAEYARKAKT